MASRAWDAWQEQNRPQFPVGTLDELKEKNLPAQIMPSCHERSFDGSVKGCPLYGICDMSYKGLTAAEGGGPRNHCWEHMKSDANGGGVARWVAPCYEGVAKYKLVAENEEVLRIIANEGESYELLTTVPDPAAGRNDRGFLRWVKKLLKVKVEPFVRLGQEPKLAAAELRASIIERDRKRMAREREARLAGVEAGGVPLDKRDSGEGKVGSKKG